MLRKAKAAYERLRTAVKNDPTLRPLSEAAVELAQDCALFTIGVVVFIFETLPPRARKRGR